MSDDQADGLKDEETGPERGPELEPEQDEPGQERDPNQPEITRQEHPQRAPRMMVQQPNMRAVVFDCPWTGHLVGSELVVATKLHPYIGRVCVKCGAMIYQRVERSLLIDGAVYPVAPAWPPD